MCRLLAYVHSGSPLSMREALGDRLLDGFLNLAEVHRDGWGTARRASASLSHYVTTRSALADKALFKAFAAEPTDSAIVHERWASPGIGLSLDNQQPFASGGLAFAHNGTIGNDAGNIVDRPASYRESLGLAHSTTMSDSRIYADLFFQKLAELSRDRQAADLASGVDEVRQALAATIAILRKDYPGATYNNVIETPDFTFATRAHAERPRTSEILQRRYKAAGWSDRIDSYYEIAYRTFSQADGSATSVASSSGYAASDPWDKLPNNRLLAISHRDAVIRILSLEL